MDMLSCWHFKHIKNPIRNIFNQRGLISTNGVVFNQNYNVFEFLINFILKYGAY